MLEWACYKKIAYELKVSERITLRVVQNRDSHGASPWYLTLDGAGSDPETSKPWADALACDLPDAVAKSSALRWARAIVDAFAAAQTEAARALAEGVR